jgi:hypothetical protein
VCSDITEVISERKIRGQGGIVFYDKGYYSDGWRYMEVAPAHIIGYAPWAWWGDFAGTQTGIGTGKRNTDLIVASQGGPSATGTAAQICAALTINGYNDWFLPSRDELNLMYQNLHRLGLGGFVNDWYWSSSLRDHREAWRQDFSDGRQSQRDQHTGCYVRAVRFF